MEKFDENESQEAVTVSEIKTFKFILLGDTNVGKTVIFERLEGRDFNKNTLSTIGMVQKTLDKEVINVKNNEKIKIRIKLWDTAGQERFRCLTSSYYRDSNGIILIYDISNVTSFEHVIKWIDSVKGSIGTGDDYKIFLLGNKRDLRDNKSDDNIKYIDSEEAKDLCENEAIEFLGECSGKTDTFKQIDDLFNKICHIVYNNVKPNAKVNDSKSLKREHGGKKEGKNQEKKNRKKRHFLCF